MLETRSDGHQHFLLSSRHRRIPKHKERETHGSPLLHTPLFLLSSGTATLKMAILVITADLQCCRCKKKIKTVLECLQEEYCIEKIEYQEKINKVIVRGKFDAEKLRKKIWCKACKAVKEIIIVDVWPPPPEPPKPKPQPAKPAYKLVPYPYPVPYPIQCQSSPWNCPPQQCHCCPKPLAAAPAPPPPPPPSPPKPKPCQCGCGSKPPTPPPCSCSNLAGCGCGCSKPPIWPAPPMWPPQHPFYSPPWSEESSPDACSTM